MPLTEAQKRAKNKYQSKAFEQIAIKPRREYCTKERIQQAALNKGITYTEWIMSTIEKALDAEGLPRPDAGRSDAVR